MKKNNIFLRVITVIVFVSLMLTRYAFNVPAFIEGILVGSLIALVLILMFPKVPGKIRNWKTSLIKKL